jgi:hypothetical protein
MQIRQYENDTKCESNRLLHCCYTQIYYTYVKGQIELITVNDRTKIEKKTLCCQVYML